MVDKRNVGRESVVALANTRAVLLLRGERALLRFEQAVSYWTLHSRLSSNSHSEAHSRHNSIRTPAADEPGVRADDAGGVMNSKSL